MRMYDIIRRKRDGGELSEAEIRHFVEGYAKGEIPDYQASALCMAIYFRGMTLAETTALTLAVRDSGDLLDFSRIHGSRTDKHSTGGVGDKTSLVVAPIVASLGVKVAKMSGRGLGHTGGTIDKLEAIPGFCTDIPTAEFEAIVNRIGIAIVGQTATLAPADKMLYALRDVTATVDSMPLIASSIMGKKLAADDDCIVLDVKTGSGSFMKTEEDSRALARIMVGIGQRAGKRTRALITDMDRPLGYAIGNTLEVVEAIETLQGGGPADLYELCIALAAHMLTLSEKGEELCRYDFDPAYLKGYALSGDGFATLLLGRYRAGSASDLVTIGRDGEPLGRLDLTGQVLSLSACGRYVAILSGQRLIVYTKDLTQYAALDDSRHARHVTLCDDGSALLADSQDAWLYIPS